VYVRPQLKPSHGICLFTTTTFGAHRGADQGVGRSTSGRDLLRQLGGSTSASPPSTAGLLQLLGLTSTRPGRHTGIPDLHRLPLAGIFLPRPTYLCPGRHMWGRGQLRQFPGRHICFPAGLYVNRPAYILAWPEFTSAGRHFPILASSGRNMWFLGRIWPLRSILDLLDRFRLAWAGLAAPARPAFPRSGGSPSAWATPQLTMSWPLPRLGHVAASTAPGPHPSRPRPGSVCSWAASRLGESGEMFRLGWAERPVPALDSRAVAAWPGRKLGRGRRSSSRPSAALRPEVPATRTAPALSQVSISVKCSKCVLVSK
jgi:hypothetical protein